MNKVILSSTVFLSLPLVASAQSVQEYLPNLMIFLSETVIPFLIGIAFLFFLINVIRYFVIGGANEESQEKAKSLAIYGIGAFVLIVIFWGIVNLFTSSLGLGGQTMLVPDYVENAALQNQTCSTGQTSSCTETFGVTVCRCQ